MMTSPPAALSAASLDELLARVGTLPLEGRAWSRPVCAIAWFVLALIALRLLTTASSDAGQSAPASVTATLMFCFAGLVALVVMMSRSVTRITADGIEQSGFTRRAVAWSDIQRARFIPLPASARLICFVGWRRPLTFQAGTPALKAAFAHIALARHPLPSTQTA